MKILFDIRKGTGGRNYKYSLNVQTYILVKGKKSFIGNVRTLCGIGANLIHSIINEFDLSGELTGDNFRIMNYYLKTKKGISIEEMNEKYEIYE